MAAPTLHPTSELVAAAWIDSIAGMPKGIVDTQLPADEQTWGDTGFVVVAVVGGSPDVDVAMKRPIIQVDCWATNPGSNKPPWFKAAALAEQIRTACYDRSTFGRALTPTANGVHYPTANCKTVYPLTEPHRIYGDAGNYAGYSLDLLLAWVEAGRTDP